MHTAIDFEMNHVRCEVTHHIPELLHVTIIRETMISCRNNSVVLCHCCCKCCKIFAVVGVAATSVSSCTDVNANIYMVTQDLSYHFELPFMSQNKFIDIFTTVLHCDEVQIKTTNICLIYFHCSFTALRFNGFQTFTHQHIHP